MWGGLLHCIMTLSSFSVILARNKKCEYKQYIVFLEVNAFAEKKIVLLLILVLFLMIFVIFRMLRSKN